jgi:cyanate lyase
MKGLSSLERIILESLGKKTMVFEEIQMQTGLHQNVCFNVLQALIIRGLLASDGKHYKVSENLSPLILEEVNGHESKVAESLELIEAIVEQKQDRVFRFQKIAIDSRDEKIFMAMLSNLDDFLADAHKKVQANVPLKDRKVIFWGMGEVKTLMSQIVTGN